ncbi:hypothetical protein SAMN05443247_06428 [Bradyrhizobium erythrophlei]|nr:hypothetical protein SAMN05443247_06428 [Bradyrhizobium erythrophlei]
MTEFVQWVNSKRVYHLDLEALDGSDFPLVSKPTWTLTHHDAAGLPAPHGIGVLETPPDCHAGRITTGPTPGTITVTVSAVISATAVATQTFTINVAAHPLVPGRSPTFWISQHRNGPMH